MPPGAGGVGTCHIVGPVLRFAQKRSGWSMLSLNVSQTNSPGITCIAGRKSGLSHAMTRRQQVSVRLNSVR